MSFLTRIISSARIILLPTVEDYFFATNGKMKEKQEEPQLSLSKND